MEPQDKKPPEEEFNPYDEDFHEIDTAPRKGHSVWTTFLAMVLDHWDEKLTPSEQLKVKRNCLLALVVFLLWASITLYNLPPRQREYQGETGTYIYYHYSKEVKLPSGELYQYRRTAIKTYYYYEISTPGGDVFTLTNSQPETKIYSGYRKMPLSLEETDLYYGFLEVEDTREYTNGFETLALVLILLPYWGFCIMCFSCPYVFSDFLVFLDMDWQGHVYSSEFYKYLRVFAVALAIFTITPTGSTFISQTFFEILWWMFKGYFAMG